MSSEVQQMSCEEKTKATVAGALSSIRLAMRSGVMDVEDLAWLGNELSLVKRELRVIQGYDVETE